MTNEFIAFVLYEWSGADDVPFFCVGVSVGRAEHLLAGPFQSKAAACATFHPDHSAGADHSSSWSTVPVTWARMRAQSIRPPHQPIRN